jgi:hypothetical protein
MRVPGSTQPPRFMVNSYFTMPILPRVLVAGR